MNIRGLFLNKWDIFEGRLQFPFGSNNMISLNGKSFRAPQTSNDEAGSVQVGNAQSTDARSTNFQADIPKAGNSQVRPTKSR